MTRLAHEIILIATQWYRRDCRESTENRGVCVDEIHERFSPSWIAQKRAEAWCAKYAWVVVDEACQRLGIHNVLPKTASAVGMRDRSSGVIRVDTTPAVGSVFYRRSSSPGSSGHVGIVTAVTADKIFTNEGNLDDRVALHYYPERQVRDPAWRFSFIHTELIGGGGGSYSGSTLLAGTSVLPALLLMSAGVGLAYTMWGRRR